MPSTPSPLPGSPFTTTRSHALANELLGSRSGHFEVVTARPYDRGCGATFCARAHDTKASQRVSVFPCFISPPSPSSPLFSPRSLPFPARSPPFLISFLPPPSLPPSLSPSCFYPQDTSVVRWVEGSAASAWAGAASSATAPTAATKTAALAAVTAAATAAANGVQIGLRSRGSGSSGGSSTSFNWSQCRHLGRGGGWAGGRVQRCSCRGSRSVDVGARERRTRFA